MYAQWTCNNVWGADVKGDEKKKKNPETQNFYNSHVPCVHYAATIDKIYLPGAEREAIGREQTRMVIIFRGDRYSGWSKLTYSEW